MNLIIVLRNLSSCFLLLLSYIATMPQSREASDLLFPGCCSAFWALLSLARGFIRQHVAWSRSSVMDVVAATDLSFGPSNTSSGLERSEPEAEAAAAVQSGQESLHPDVVSGLVHLHHLGIIHRDLVTKELCAKLSDMSSSKLLLGGASSSEYFVADCGSSRLQAPEQLCNVHQTCSVDVFGLNHVSFICITGRRHPFGDSLEDDRNIEANAMDLSSVEFMPEAADLFACLPHPDPYLRPKALEHACLEDEGRLGNSVGNDDAWMNLEKPVGGGTSGCWIGKLFVSNTEIAKGSKGTIILEGFYEGQPVAVKRLALAHHYVASQEIRSLRASDRDPNIVRLYGAENDQDFVYLALERCACSLDDLIQAHSNSSEKYVFPDDLASNTINEYKLRLDSVKRTMQDVNLWREDGHPSPLLRKLMRDVVSGLVHLHRLGIIHRDLKPQSVLITKEFCAKLSDMGSSKLLREDTSPSGYHVPDCGNLALHTAEQLCPAHQMCSVDLFGLGCILFFCITGGKHPFGDSLKGDNNIKEYSINLSPVEFLPEAADLFARLLNPNPNLRPKALEVLHHPLFWNSKTGLSFLRDASDWVEFKARGTNSDLMGKLESIAQQVFDEEWNGKIDRKVIKHMRRFRVYKFEKARDLLRIVRNTFCHAIGLPRKIQKIVGSSPEDMDSYFAKRFPRLLIETYRFVSMCCKDEERFPFPEYFS